MNFEVLDHFLQSVSQAVLMAVLLLELSPVHVGLFIWFTSEHFGLCGFTDSLVIHISSSILSSLMYTDLVLFICVHHQRPVFNVVLCYTVLPLLRDDDPSLRVQRVLCNPDRLIPWGNSVTCWPMCVIVCVFVCVHC